MPSPICHDLVSLSRDERHEPVKTGELVETFNLRPEKYKDMIVVPNEFFEELFNERGQVYPRKSDIDGEFSRI